MVKFMLKRGLVTDLARIPHSLDMSSPLMAFTVNAALKPLESLSRIVNLPPAAANSARPLSKPKADDGQQDSGAQNQQTQPQLLQQQLSSSTTENTRAQAAEISNALDGENTEQDVSAAGEILDNLGDGEVASGDNGLEEIMDQHSHVMDFFFVRARRICF